MNFMKGSHLRSVNWFFRARIRVARTTCCPGDLAPASSQEAALNTPLWAVGSFITAKIFPNIFARIGPVLRLR